MARRLAAGLVLAVLLAACTTDDPGPTGASTAPVASPGTATEATATASGEASGTTADQRYPDVVEVALSRTGDTWSVAATISSPYDSPDRYADAFRVLAPDGRELGVRELLHDHEDEQPFTRSLDDLAIPGDVAEVTVEARDLANGWGGDTVTVPVEE